MKAVVIDDSRAIRMIIGRTLKQLGFEIREAGNGAEGLRDIKEDPNIDLVLVDWNMPEMNGIDFLTALREEPELASLPVLMVTSESEPAQAERAMKAGASDYVTKPFSREVLVERLQRLGFNA